MISNYNIPKLEELVRDFNYITGVSITPFDAEGNPITTTWTATGGYCNFISLTKVGRCSCERSNKALMKKCRESKKTERHICASGLCDIAIPLIHREEIVGYLMIGQIRISDQFPDYAPISSQEREKIREYYYKIPLFDEKMIKSVINMGSIMTKYIIFENIIKGYPKKSATVIADYIEEHINERMTVESISRNTHISVSGIYKIMREAYGKTLGKYILDLRISSAELLLKEEDMSIEKVAEAVGFTDSAYFSRLFKKSRGISPMKYRKQIK